jgi:hypothetical protein
LRPWLADEAQVAQRILWVGLAFLLVVWLVRQVEVVAVAAFLGFAQTALLWPVVKRLRRFLPGGLAAILVVTVYAAAIVSLIWFIIVELSRSWSGLVESFLSGLDSANTWLQDIGLSLTPEILQNLGTQFRGTISQFFNGVSSFAMTGITAVSTLVTVIVVATFATLFCLASGDDLWRSVLDAIHPARRARIDGAMRAGLRTARWWMFASTATGLVDGLFIGLGLWFLGVPFVVPIMVLTFHPRLHPDDRGHHRGSRGGGHRAVLRRHQDRDLGPHRRAAGAAGGGQRALPAAAQPGDELPPRGDAAAPSPIQAVTLPDTLAGKDVLGRGKTGSARPSPSPSRSSPPRPRALARRPRPGRPAASCSSPPASSPTRSPPPSLPSPRP